MPFDWETPAKAADTGRKKEEGPVKSSPGLLDEPEMTIGNQATLRLLGEAPAPVVGRTEGGLYATVYFGRNNFLLDGANYLAVMKLADELRYMLGPSIMIDGHASGEGTAAYNLTLSEKRRQAVIALLTGKLTGKPRVSGVAYGESKPAVAEAAKKGKERDRLRALNRRVEIYIMFTPASKPKEPEKKPDLRLKEKTEPETLPETLKEKLDRIMKEKPPEPLRKRSFSEMFWSKFDEKTEDILRKAGVPAKYRPYIKDAARAAVEKGAEKALDEALDKAGLDEKAKRAVKEAIKAAGETKL